MTHWPQCKCQYHLPIQISLIIFLLILQYFPALTYKMKHEIGPLKIIVSNYSTPSNYLHPSWELVSFYRHFKSWVCESYGSIVLIQEDFKEWCDVRQTDSYRGRHDTKKIAVSVFKFNCFIPLNTWKRHHTKQSTFLNKPNIFSFFDRVGIRLIRGYCCVRSLLRGASTNLVHRTIFWK